MSAVLVPTASEAEWLEARRQGVTASEIAVIMGLSPYSSPYKLYHQKLGILPPDDDSAVMERGRVLEPVIAEKFGKLHGDYAVLGDGRQLYQHGERAWQMATPDRMVHRIVEVDHCTCGGGLDPYGHEPRCGWELDAPVGVLECKVDGGSDEWGEPGTDEIPVAYRAQVLWQMDVMGVDVAHVACLRVRQWDVRTYVVRHAEGCGPGRNMLAYPSLACPACDDVVLMRDEAREFLGRIDAGEPPDLDWRPATIAALKTMHPGVEDVDVEVRRSLAIQYRAAVKRYKDAERRKDEMTARMLDAIGDGRRAVSCGRYAGVGDPGDVIATRSVSHPKRIDTEKLRSAYPAIAAECTKPPKPEVKLTPAKPKDKKSVSPDSE